MIPCTLFLPLSRFAKRGFPVRCAGGQDEVDRFEKRVSERNGGALITTSSFEGVIARLQA